MVEHVMGYVSAGPFARSEPEVVTVRDRQGSETTFAHARSWTVDEHLVLRLLDSDETTVATYHPAAWESAWKVTGQAER